MSFLNLKPRKEFWFRKRLWEPQKNISFQCRPNVRNYKIYIFKMWCLLPNSSYDEIMFLWIICDLELIHNYINHTLYFLLQLKWRKKVNESFTCFNLIPRKFTPFCHQFVVILLMLLRSKGEISTFSLYFQIIV